MAEGTPGRGRGGRGAMIAKLLAEMKRPCLSHDPLSAGDGPPLPLFVGGSQPQSQPAGDSSPLPPPAGDGPPPTIGNAPPFVQEELQIPINRPLGRGAQLKRLLEANQTPALPTPQPILVDHPLVSRGRGRLLEIGLLNRQPSATMPATPISTESVSLSSNLETEAASTTSVKSITKQFKRIQVDSSKEPNVNLGTTGEEYPATANYIPLYLKAGRGIYEYEVRFSPQVDDKIMCEKMLFVQHKELFRRNRTFDGVTMYLPRKLEDKETKLESSHPVTKETHGISLIFKRERSMGECTHMFNVLFSIIQRELGMIKLNREYYSKELAHKIHQHKLEIWPGYVTAVDVYEGGIMLMCNASNKVVRTQTVLDIIKDIVSQVGGSSDYKNLVLKELSGQSVMTMKPVRMYRIDDIDFSQNPTSTFQRPDGSLMDYVEYHRQKDIVIKDLKQPLLVHRPKPSKRPGGTGLLMLIPELCYMTGMTDNMRSDFKLMKDVATCTRVSPNERQRYLQNFIEKIRDTPECVKLLDEWGLQLPESTININSRHLPPEKIYFGRNHEEIGSINADWSRAATSQHMLETVDICDWLVVHTHKDEFNARNFVEFMSKVCPKMGARIHPPNIQKLRDDKTETYLKTIRERLNRNVQLVVIIFPSPRDDRYSAVKKLCCVERPIPSQCINSRTISKPDKLRSVVQKIALQINCKLGGALWALKIPFSNAMICGIDTYHDTKNRARSVAGFVASMNSSVTRWYSQVFMQSSDREMVDGLRAALATALHKYAEVNNRHPDIIVCYRDGVGDGQLTVCKEHEVKALEKAFTTVSPDYKPKMTFIVCQKRINTRFFFKKNKDFENPLPGSIVDHTITRRYLYDFFLVSQLVRQGTVTPTHYIVLHNTTNMDADKIQRLTYKMCHLYYNWPGTIRVPAPCQYAHKLAYLVGSSIHKDPAQILCDKLFFL